MDELQRIISVERGSAAWKAGIRAGDVLTRIDFEPVCDVLDYAFLTQSSVLNMQLLDKRGKARTVTVRKEETQPMGLTFERSLMSEQQRCRNKCVFCFEDQNPPCVRESLRAKDDDWRLSLMMGNFVTLTNVGDDTLERIIKRRVSPLYISVHTTDPSLRRRMMGNPKAGDIMSQLNRLASAGLSFHAQAVLCPGVNDGEALESTLDELYALRPYALSCALVPVGLTAHREGLSPITPFTCSSAACVVDMVEKRQRGYLAQGSRFVFAADEFYVLAGRALPEEDAYEDYWQLENGVGMMRKFQTEFERAQEARDIPKGRVSLVTGELAAPWMCALVAPLGARGLEVDVIAARNGFFGGGVNVTGLLAGTDILHALGGRELGEKLLLPLTLLRHEGDMLLDDMTPETLQRAVNCPIEWVDVDGCAFLDALAPR